MAVIKSGRNSNLRHRLISKVGVIRRRLIGDGERVGAGKSRDLAGWLAASNAPSVNRLIVSIARC